MSREHFDRADIRDAIHNWILWRDAADWSRFRTVWSADGWMTATWFQGPADEFIEVSRDGFDRGVRILHFLGGTSINVNGNRAIAQTKMTISQRAPVHEVEVDVTCTGRFYDFFRREENGWKLVRRQPIYEKDRMDPVAPDASLALDADTLQKFPIGYRHLAYLQQQAGYQIHPALPGPVGDAVELLYWEGAQWLAGSQHPGTPLGGDGPHAVSPLANVGRRLPPLHDGSS